MEPSELPDWRIRRAAKIAEVEQRGGVPFGKPGDVIVILTETSTSEFGRISFPAVSPYRQALHTSIRAVREARCLLSEIHFAGNRGDKVRVVDSQSIARLYDYFEKCMIAVTFSFQSLETFANEVIDEHLDSTESFTLPRRVRDPENGDWVERDVRLSAGELQRDLSTEEKLATVVPQLLKLPKSPKGTKAWESFKALKRVRDSVIHLKTKDRESGISQSGKGTLPYEFLNTNPRRYPRAAIEMMIALNPKGKPTWLVFAEKEVASE